MSTNDTLRGLLPCQFCGSTTGVCDLYFPHPRTGATVKDCLTVRKAYVVYADNGNVICFSTDRQHHSILSLEEKGYPVVVLAEPVSGGEFGDPYQGARQDLAIWKKRALEAEKALREERILTERLCNALNEENGPMFMGEPNLAALNGGAVAGRKPFQFQAPSAEWMEAMVKLEEGVTVSAGVPDRTPICDCHQGRDACTGKPLESERGGE